MGAAPVRLPASAQAVSRRPPLALLAPAAVAFLFLVVPVVGLLARAPWSQLGHELAAADVRRAIGLSLVTSVSAAALALVLGAPLAWVLARVEFPGKVVVRAVALLPLVLPPVVGGVALLYALGRNGLLGSWLARVGVALPFTTAGAVVAELFVALPFAVITVEAGVRALDERLEEAAATLGAGVWLSLRRVVLPALAPSLAAAAALCWARALGEFGATITFAGNLPGRTQTLPLAVYLELQQRPGVAVLLSLVLLALSIAVLVLLRGRWLSPRRS
ncbi:MAG: molybdate ABC transporter permease subunit [Acidimicrobiia bacterium]|nr:molybdate ABC transporter permease subunit [Acidimicrobiia bacterium]